LEEYLEVVNLQAVVWEGGAMGAETLFIGKLVIMEMLRIEYNTVCQETGWTRETVDLGMRQYAVYAVLGLCGTQSTHLIMAWRD
jgi:hypothetical protein